MVMCVCVCVCADFHELMYDLLRRCVAGELEVEETAAFFTDLTTNLVSGALCVRMCVCVCLHACTYSIHM